MAEITSIPKLIATHGSIAAACRATGLCELTLSKYQKDIDCEHHVIYKDRLMTHKNGSPVLYTRRGVTRTDRANGRRNIEDGYPGQKNNITFVEPS